MSKQWWVVGTVVIAMIVGAVALVKNSPDNYGVAVNKKAPDFRVLDLATNDTVSLREKYAGQVTLVNIWATWCAPCREEMPAMEAAYKDLAPRGFRVAAVSIDDGDPAGVLAFGTELGLTFDLLLDRSGEIQRIYQTTGVPESFLLDHNGVIIKRIIGTHDWSSKANRDLIERLLDQQKLTHPMRVLGIESSCDETSAAVVRLEQGRPALESVVILSQDVHTVFGGVVPELASRAHLTAIAPVVDRALAEAGATLDDIDAIAVTSGPGLVGALLVGLMYGKTLAWSTGKPLIGVHHMEGHLFAPALEDADFAPPFVALLVSGGHTLLLDVPAWGEYRLLGQTLDDAAGEAFDKVATLLGLGYPGGAPLERLAATGTAGKFVFPRPLLRDLKGDGPNRWNFSFSGLKTAVLRAVRQSTDLDAERADLARGFQDAALDVLVQKTAAAVEELGYPLAMIGGGVACNRALALRLRERLGARVRLSVASPRLNTDNAAMIAAAGAWRLARGETSGPGLEPSDSLPLPGLFTTAA